jgi:hypothetical protein
VKEREKEWMGERKQAQNGTDERRGKEREREKTEKNTKEMCEKGIEKKKQHFERTRSTCQTYVREHTKTSKYKKYRG